MLVLISSISNHCSLVEGIYLSPTAAPQWSGYTYPQPLLPRLFCFFFTTQAGVSILNPQPLAMLPRLVLLSSLPQLLLPGLVSVSSLPDYCSPGWCWNPHSPGWCLYSRSLTPAPHAGFSIHTPQSLIPRYWYPLSPTPAPKVGDVRQGPVVSLDPQLQWGGGRVSATGGRAHAVPQRPSAGGARQDPLLVGGRQARTHGATEGESGQGGMHYPTGDARHALSVLQRVWVVRQDALPDWGRQAPSDGAVDCECR